MTTPAFYTARQRLTRYALACGYTERTSAGVLFARHGVLFVRNSDGLQVWAGNSLTDARKALDGLKGSKPQAAAPFARPLTY